MPRSHSTLVPYMPMCSSSAARWNVSVPARSMPARRIAAAAASADATGPFMSAEPRPISRPSSTDALPRSVEPVRRVADGHDVEVAVPREGRAFARADRGDDARPALLAPDRLGRRADRRRGCPTATAAATSSVPPGFSLGAAIKRARERQDLVGVDRRRGCLRDALIYHGDRWYPSPRCERRSALRWNRIRRRRPIRAIAWRPSSRRSSRNRSPRWSSPSARATCLVTPARSRSRGLQDPGETLGETALREAFEEIGLDPADDGAARRAAAGPHDRERDPGRPVRGHAGVVAGVRGE